MTHATLRKKGVVTIPSAIRKAARLAEGDVVEVELTDDGILLKPKRLVDATQAWFWTPAWQAMEREADEDIAAGRVERFESDGEFLAALEERSAVDPSYQPSAMQPGHPGPPPPRLGIPETGSRPSKRSAVGRAFGRMLSLGRPKSPDAPSDS